jgi:hypothetical protein
LPEFRHRGGRLERERETDDREVHFLEEGLDVQGLEARRGRGQPDPELGPSGDLPGERRAESADERRQLEVGGPDIDNGGAGGTGRRGGARPEQERPGDAALDREPGFGEPNGGRSDR